MKMNIWKVSVVGLILAALFSIPLMRPNLAAAQEGVQVVYPTGLYPQDVANVQAALNIGGTVLLKAVDQSGVPTPFNFGPPEPGSGRVFLNRDAVLMGETKGDHMTVIQGGDLPIRGGLPVISSIRNIHFEGPYASAILIGTSLGTEIVGNRVTNVIGFPLVPGFRKAVGIWVSGFTPEDISGEVLVKDNLVHNLDAEIGDGIALVVLGAEARVIGNEIRGVDNAGILVNGHTRPVWVEQNLVIPGAGVYPASAVGNGIAAGHIFPVDPQAPVHIRHNTVICDNPFADGILLYDIDGSTVVQNRVVMHDGFFGGITLYDGVSNTYLGQNQVEGVGAFALDILLVGFSTDPQSSSNEFVGNNITSFDSLIADVFLDANTSGTKFEGFCRSFYDFGVDNEIKCPAGRAPVDFVTQQIAQAREMKRPFFQYLQAKAPY